MSKYAPHRRSVNQPRATSSTVCQKCLKTGHFIYECNSTRPYVSRPSRTQQLENPRVLAKLKSEGKPSVEVPEEFKQKSGTANRILETNERERQKENKEGTSRKKVKRSSSLDSDSSNSDSSSDDDSGSGSDSDSSRSRERGRKRRLPAKRDRSSSRSSSSDSDISRGRKS